MSKWTRQVTWRRSLTWRSVPCATSRRTLSPPSRQVSLCVTSSNLNLNSESPPPGPPLADALHASSRLHLLHRGAALWGVAALHRAQPAQPRYDGPPAPQQDPLEPPAIRSHAKPLPRWGARGRWRRWRRRRRRRRHPLIPLFFSFFVLEVWSCVKGGKKERLSTPLFVLRRVRAQCPVVSQPQNRGGGRANGWEDGWRWGAVAPSCGEEDRGPVAATAAQKRLKRTAGFKDRRMILSKYILRDFKSCLFI